MDRHERETADAERRVRDLAVVLIDSARSWRTDREATLALAAAMVYLGDRVGAQAPPVFVLHPSGDTEQDRLLVERLREFFDSKGGT